MLVRSGPTELKTQSVGRKTGGNDAVDGTETGKPKRYQDGILFISLYFVSGGAACVYHQ